MERRHHNENNSFSDQKGIALLLGLPILFVMLSLTSLLLYQGFMYEENMRLMMISDAAAVAALEGLNRDASMLTFEERKEQARQVVQDLLDDNASTFALGPGYQQAQVVDATEDPYVNTHTNIQFGFWCKNGATCSCAEGKQECFEPSDALEDPSGTTRPRAVKVFVNLSGSAYKIPKLISLFGNNQDIDLASESIAREHPRCSAFTIDISPSGSADSHHTVTWGGDLRTYDSIGILEIDSPLAGDPYGRNFTISTPSMFGMFAILLPTGYATSSFDPANNIEPYDCSVDPFTAPLSTSHLYRCAMEPVRPPTCTIPGDTTSGCKLHYRSDYVPTETPYGNILIDYFTSPEPFTSLLKALNASLVSIKENSSGMDSVAVLPFATEIYGSSPAEGFTRDLDYLIDISDLRRVGSLVYDSGTGGWIKTGAVSPNAYERGWFPSSANSGTDIAHALIKAHERLSDPNNCGVDNAKHIFLFSDGRMTFSRDYDPATGDMNLDEAFRLPIRYIRDYYNIESVIARQYSGFSVSLVEKFRGSAIQVSTLLYGESVDPNFLNRQIPGSSPPDFYTLEELSKDGYVGVDGGGVTELVNIRLSGNRLWDGTEPPAVSAHPYCQNIWEDYYGYGYTCSLIFSSKMKGVVFRRPNGFMAELALNTGGLHCPLMQPYESSPGVINSACYKADGYWDPAHTDPSCARTDNTFQTKSIFRAYTAGQAQECIRKVLKGAVFTLAQER